MSRVLILHAYSRRNRGDGLLVDESIRLVHQALGRDTELTVVAADARSFSDLPRVVQVPGLDRNARRHGVASTATRLALRATGAPCGYPFLDVVARGTTLIVGVGGGYLRTGGPSYTLKMLLAHLPQLDWAVRSGVPSIYLPQSVGPLEGPGGRWVRQKVARLGTLIVRDDRSAQQLGPLPNLMRLPDLAVLAAARTIGPSRRLQYPSVYLIARDLPLGSGARADYIERLQRLRSLLPDLQPVVQSEGGGNDDPAFYRGLGWPEPFLSAEAMLARSDGIVVSVRLHGSVGAVIARMPSVHLAYERKGYGAYADLGLTEYLHGAGSFSPEIVHRQVRTLQKGAGSFWQAIADRSPQIRSGEQKIVELMRAMAQLQGGKSIWHHY